MSWEMVVGGGGVCTCARALTNPSPHLRNDCTDCAEIWFSVAGAYSHKPWFPWPYSHKSWLPVGGLLLKVCAVGGLRGWRFARLAVCAVGGCRFAVCAVGGLRGWRFARLAVCVWRFAFGGLAVNGFRLAVDGLRLAVGGCWRFAFGGWRFGGLAFGGLRLAVCV